MPVADAVDEMDVPPVVDPELVAVSLRVVVPDELTDCVADDVWVEVPVSRAVLDFESDTVDDIVDDAVVVPVVEAVVILQLMNSPS